jgi:DNA-binding HxlR family transcriptional regulator
MLCRMARKQLAENPCPIARSVGVLGERWTFLILRDALDGTTRFAEWRASLGIAADVLTERLTTLVEHGVLSREPYRVPGSRIRYEYHLTPAGAQLKVALAALQQWGEEHLPWPDGPIMVQRVRDTGAPTHVGFVDGDGREVPAEAVDLRRTAAVSG